MSCILVCTHDGVRWFADNEHHLLFWLDWYGTGGYLGGVIDLQSSYTTSFTFAMVMGLINVFILSLFALYIRSARRHQTQHSL